MRLILVLIVSFTIQVRAQDSIRPNEYYYVSRWDNKDANVFFEVGQKLLFSQNCITTLPKNVINGIVYFENFYFEEEKFSYFVEFKDTVIVAAVLYFKKKQTRLLYKFGDVAFQRKRYNIKGKWTYIYTEKNVQTVITSDRKKVRIIKTLLPSCYNK